MSTFKNQMVSIGFEYIFWERVENIFLVFLPRKFNDILKIRVITANLATLEN